MLRWLEDVHDGLRKMKVKGRVGKRRMDADCTGGQSSP
jgi:hypothetical protein